MDFEIRVSRNRWDSMEGWNWRVWSLQKNDVVEWGWAPDSYGAYVDASSALLVLERENGK